MQTLADIRKKLARAGLRPNRRWGQCFMVDPKAMEKLLTTAEPLGGIPVLEVGPGTGSLTGELLDRGLRVVAVEIDPRLAGLLRRDFADSIRDGKLTLLQCDALEGKNHLSSLMLQSLAPEVQLVANLPYQIATPLVAECLFESFRSLRGGGVCFRRLTFTVQQEVADRFASTSGGGYGPVSVVAGIMGKVTLGAKMPPGVFWPRPKIQSQIVRVDFCPSRAAHLQDAGILRTLLRMVFSQRRKRIASSAKARGAPFDADRFAGALSQASVDPTIRPQEVSPDSFLKLSNALTVKGESSPKRSGQKEAC